MTTKVITVTTGECAYKDLNQIISKFCPIGHSTLVLPNDIYRDLIKRDPHDESHPMRFINGRCVVRVKSMYQVRWDLVLQRLSRKY